MDLDTLWQEVLLLLQRALTEVVFTSMILTLRPIKMENGTLTLEAKNRFFMTTVNKRYLFEIARCVKTITDMDVEVRIISPDGDDEGLDDTKISPAAYTKTNLRQKYTFETFVQGKSNEMAYAAAMAVAEAPGGSNYNPLFLYGGVGLGKTHLLQSIGNHVVELFPDMNVLYQSTEIFTNELITAIREKTTQA